MPIILSVVLSLSLFATPLQSLAKPGSRDTVESAISEGIRLLEAKDYRTFLSQFMAPNQLKERAGTPESLEALAQEFSSRADRLLMVLKTLRTQTPAYDQAKTSASFQVDQPGMPSSLTFVKIGTLWYISSR